MHFIIKKLRIMGEMIQMTKDIVECWKCKGEFDLVQAEWCNCGFNKGRLILFRSKICPHCGRCLCGVPTLADRDLTEAPNSMKNHGFNWLYKVEEHQITPSHNG